MKIRRGELQLEYSQAGQGSQTILMMHGWGTDQTLMQPLFERLQSAYRVISIDLPGFGASTGHRQHFSIESYTEDLASLFSDPDPDLALDRPVMIGHSMGGMIALDFAARFAENLTATIILEAAVVPPELVIERLNPVLDGLRSEAYREVVKNFMSYLGGPFIEPQKREQLLRAAFSVPQNVLVSSMEGMIAFDSRTAASKVKCPLLYIGTNTTFTNMDHFRELCPQLVCGQLVGCGHYFPLEVPEQLYPMIARFLQTKVFNSWFPANS